MSGWGPATYGDPCRECGFDWSLSLDRAVQLMSGLAATYDEVLAGATGSEQLPELAWPVGAYVSHVADNLRIWTERLMGVTLGAGPEVGGYDENELAQARRYDLIPLEASRWSLRLSVAEWVKAIEASSHHGTVMIHPQRGELDLSDVARSNAHDARHHLFDIERTLRS
jgi:hypothetical protein